MTTASPKPLVAILLLVAGILAAFVFMRPRPTAIEIPSPDLTTANVHVAEVTDRLKQQVLSQPKSAVAWGSYGEILMAHEWTSEALICFQHAAELEKNNMRWPYLAGILLERRQPAEAVQMFEAARQLKSDYAPLHYRLSKTLLRLDKLVDAEASMKAASHLASNQPQPFIGLARIAEARNDWQAAHDFLEQALKLAPTNREAIVEITRAKIMLGTAKALDRKEQTALLSGEKYEPMADPIFNSINEREVAARVDAALADHYAASGNAQQAADAFLQLIAKRPTLVRPRLNLATLYMQQKNYAEALKTLEEVTKLFPDDAQGHYLSSFALEATQRLPEARQALETAVRLKPDYAEAHYALGLSYQREGKLVEAEAAYRAAVHSDVRMPQAHLALGVVLQKQSKWEEAIAEMNIAIRLAPGDPVPESYLRKAIAQRDAEK